MKQQRVELQNGKRTEKIKENTSCLRSIKLITSSQMKREKINKITKKIVFSFLHFLLMSQQQSHISNNFQKDENKFLDPNIALCLDRHREFSTVISVCMISKRKCILLLQRGSPQEDRMLSQENARDATEVPVSLCTAELGVGQHGSCSPSGPSLALQEWTLPDNNRDNWFPGKCLDFFLFFIQKRQASL